MIDYTREDVIEALEYLLSPACTETQFDYCDEIRAAIALLKEQEPRVMTWGKVLEFIELPNEGFSEKTPCYVEVYEPDPDNIKWVDAETLHGWLRNCKMLEQRRLLYNRIGRRGWRLWTSRPTDEQRKKVAWDD